MRGEDGLALGEAGFRPGSPPHARGRHAKLEKKVTAKGITPACAGKTAQL